MEKPHVFRTFSKKLITITHNLTKLEVVSGWAQPEFELKTLIDTALKERKNGDG